MSEERELNQEQIDIYEWIDETLDEIDASLRVFELNPNVHERLSNMIYNFFTELEEEVNGGKICSCCKTGVVIGDNGWFVSSSVMCDPCGHKVFRENYEKWKSDSRRA